MVFYQLAKGGQIVLNMDATGGLLDFPLSDDDQKCKILHTKVAVKPLYSLVDAEHMRDKTVARMVSPLTVAEMASNSNKATDIAEFLHCFFKDVKRVGKSEIPVNPPLLCQSDCSAALEAGALRAFSNSDKTMATTRIEYSNITLLHLLHYDCLTKDLSASESRKQPALAVLNSMKPSVPTFLKECSAHVCRAPPKWVKRTEGVEGSETKSRFENLMWSVFLSLIRERRVSVLIVKLSLVVAMLETESFVSPPFTKDSVVKDSREPAEMEEEKRLALTIQAFIIEEASNLHISSLDEVKQQLINDNVVKHHIAFHEGIVERAKGLMRQQASIYLNHISIDNSNSSWLMGVLRCSIVYGVLCSDQYEGDEVKPLLEAGLNVTVGLPFDGGQSGVKNPLFSMAAAQYLREEWMFKTSLWCRGIVDVLENALDMEIEDSNQLLEAVIKNVKHNQNVHAHTGDLGLYMVHRFRDSEASVKQLMLQYSGLKRKVKDLESRRAKRQQQRRSKEMKSSSMSSSQPQSLTQDEQVQHHEEEVVGEQWSRKGAKVETDAQLRMDLVAIFSQFEEQIGGTSATKQHAYVLSSLNENERDKVMSYGVFNKFMRGMHESAKGLKSSHVAVLQEFICKKQEELQRAAISAVGDPAKIAKV